jgi:hypothetical protein
MNFRWLTTGLVIVLAATAGCISYLCLRDPLPDSAAREDDALLWLRHEFKIPGEKMARIEAMHSAYQIVCEEHCRAIRDARSEVRRLRAAHVSGADIAQAEAKSKEVDLVCTTSLTAHMREIAAVIGGDDGQRYLSIVLPRIEKFDHAAAPALDLESATPHAGHDRH